MMMNAKRLERHYCIFVYRLVIYVEIVLVSPLYIGVGLAILYADVTPENYEALSIFFDLIKV
jgi:hypothetical protein